MTRRANHHLVWVALGSLMGVVACGSGQLEPAAHAEVARSAADVALARSASGVVLAANARAWPGSPRVAQKLTPIQLNIANRGREPIQASLGDIRLITPRGALVARPPESIDLEPQATTVGKTAVDFDSESGTYEFAARNPAKTQLAHQLSSLSLPEGPIASGEQVQGFIYFDALPSDARTATLEVAIRRDPAGPVDARLTIPFERN